MSTKLSTPTNVLKPAHPPEHARLRSVASIVLVFALLVALVTGCTESTIPDPDPDPDPDPLEVSVELAPIAPGFVNPVAVTNAGDGSGRLFVAQRRGLVYVVDGMSVQEAP